MTITNENNHLLKYSEEEILKHTPMMQAYLRVKKDYFDKLVFYRMGDFYELFFDDAIIASKILSIALTKRARTENNEPIPMAGVPFHALDNYLGKALKSGYSAVVCEQIGEPNKKGIMSREVVKIVTPGTILETGIIEEKEIKYLASVYKRANHVDIAWINLSIGEVWCNSVPIEKFIMEIEKINPSEIIISEKQINNFEFPENISIKQLPHWEWEETIADNNLKVHFGQQWLHLFGLRSKEIASVISSLINYLKVTQKSNISHVQNIKWVKSEDYIQISRLTNEHLELIYSKNGKTLWSILDNCATNMGSRLLKSWLVLPIKNQDILKSRLDRVEFLFSENKPYLTWMEMAQAWCDIERISARIALKIVRPRELASLRDTLRMMPKLQSWAENLPPHLRGFFQHAIPNEAVLKLLERYLLEEPSAFIRDGEVISSSVNNELSQCRDLMTGHEKFLKKFEDEEKIKNNIPNLKVDYNLVHGFYISISKSHLSKVPGNYKIKQTMKNATRYTTLTLQEYESKSLSAKDRALKLEKQLYEELLNKLSVYVGILQKQSRILAEWDVLASLASNADVYNYCRPAFSNQDEKNLLITEGRHPVVERNIDNFVPNDIKLNQENKSIIITGPNMGGKSTIMRQIALIVIMANIGSFVPAKKAIIPSIDAIYTRIGASDDLAAARSTFMVEMSEAAYITNNATENSLIIIDELGRGTATYDGLSLAWEITKYLINQVNCYLLFATHYLEMCEMEEKYSRIKNYHVEALEQEHEVIFTHKLLPGSAKKSYGLHVAKLAGVNHQIIADSKEKLLQLEQEEKKTKKIIKNDLYLDDKLKLKLKNLDVMSITPMEAIGLIEQIKKNLK